jgi:hypothetical protein
METQNPYTVKKTVEITRTIKVQEEIDVIDWSLVPEGTYMTGKIDETEVEGVLAKEDGDLFFCQNKRDGAEPKFKFGFKHGWAFTQRENGTHSSAVTDIQFPPKPADLVIPPIPPIPPAQPKPIKMIVGEYKSEVYSDHIQVGCQTISKETVLEVLAKMEEQAKSVEETK